MQITLYLVHGSHPCAAVAKALELKDLPYRVREWPPPLHAAAQKAIFGSRTVPAIKLDGEKLTGSSAIFKRLDELVPEPSLYPSDPARASVVEETEQWGSGDFQQLARDLIWAGMRHRPDALPSYAEHSRLPLPAVMVRASAPLIVGAQRRLNKTDDEVASRRLAELPGILDKIDAWIADGTLGDTIHPNAADLQIFATVRLLSTVSDLEQVLAGRPALAAALALYPEWDGVMPAGALPLVGDL